MTSADRRRCRLLCATGKEIQQFFRIGTGGAAGTYYPVGGMIAQRRVATRQNRGHAQASNGSLANVNAIAGGAMESGFLTVRRGHLGLHRHRALRPANPRSATCA